MENNNKEVTIASDDMDGGETSMQNKVSSMQMENNNKQKEVTGDEDNLVTSTMQKELGCLGSSNSKCCIYKVPEFIRKEKEDCYRPKVISIGPIFYQDPQLETMQELKWIFLEWFLQHPHNACRSLDSYIETVRRLKKDIRDCYQDQKMLLRDDKFVEMIVLDAIFLLSYFILTFGNICHFPPIIRSLPRGVVAKLYFMKTDLLVEENQLPFFVLKDIFDKAFPEQKNSSLIYLTHSFIASYDIPGSVIDDAPDDIEHLLDFWWKRYCLPFKGQQKEHKHEDITVRDYTDVEDPSSRNKVDLPKTAKELTAAGVKFKVNPCPKLVGIKFDKSTGELQIPKLALHDYTETLFRSILFFEQSRYPWTCRTFFTNFVTFLDALIDTDEDIQILQKNGILQNFLGSVDKKVADLFNYYSKNTQTCAYNYSGVAQQVNAYANKSWNRWKAILRRDYFSHPWAIISVMFATMVFILTVLQTITGFTKN